MYHVLLELLVAMIRAIYGASAANGGQASHTNATVSWADMRRTPPSRPRLYRAHQS